MLEANYFPCEKVMERLNRQMLDFSNHWEKVSPYTGKWEAMLTKKGENIGILSVYEQSLELFPQGSSLKLPHNINDKEQSMKAGNKK